MSDSYAIMRMEKIKSRVSLHGALKHNNRDRIPPNADPTRLKENVILRSTAEALARYTAKLPKDVRKNAVHAVEVLMTASPEWYENADEKKEDEWGWRSLEWCRSLFGKDNVLSFSLHKDEKTTHLHCICMPLVDGKLNARALIGGKSNRMAELQTDYYEQVGRPLGMKRGIEKTGRKHTRPSEYERILARRAAELDRREAALEGHREAAEETLKQGLGKGFEEQLTTWKLGLEDVPLFWEVAQKTFKSLSAKREKERKEAAEEARKRAEAERQKDSGGWSR